MDVKTLKKSKHFYLMLAASKCMQNLLNISLRNHKYKIMYKRYKGAFTLGHEDIMWTRVYSCAYSRSRL